MSQCVVMCRYVSPCIFICVATCGDVPLYVLMMCMSSCIARCCCMSLFVAEKSKVVLLKFRLDGDLSGVFCGSKTENMDQN